MPRLQLVYPGATSGGQWLVNIKEIGSQASDIADAVGKMMGYYNSAIAVAQLLGIMDSGPSMQQIYDMVVQLQGAVSGLSWQANSIATNEAMGLIQAVYGHARECLAQSPPEQPCALTAYGTGDELQAATALYTLEGSGMDSRTFLETLTDGPWKNLILSRPKVTNGLVFDWRLIAPVLLEAIAQHVVIMNSDPSSMCAHSYYWRDFLSKHIARLRKLRSDMMEGVRCHVGWEKFNVGSLAIRNRILCADYHTGVSSDPIVSDTCRPRTSPGGAYVPYDVYSPWRPPYSCSDISNVYVAPDDYAYTSCTVRNDFGNCVPTWGTPATIVANVNKARDQLMAAMPFAQIDAQIAALDAMLSTGCLPSKIDPSPWKIGQVGSASQTYPLDFNVFSIGNIGGLRDAQGPIAAGGAVALDSFNLNPINKLVGIVSVGRVDLTNGTVLGAVYAGGGLNPTNVTRNSPETYTQVPIDFASADTQLRMFSSQLANLSAGPVQGGTFQGAWSSYYGNLLMGTCANPVLCVFSLPSSALENVYSIAFSGDIPASATVIVNVGGSAVRIQNAGMTMRGVKDSSILWNLYEASTASIASVGFHGSILAPKATLTANNGNLWGTVVASSVSGSQEFYEAPFQGNWLVP
jgi:choice-of-anchor A domain-containing protein